MPPTTNQQAQDKNKQTKKININYQNYDISLGFEGNIPSCRVDVSGMEMRRMGPAHAPLSAQNNRGSLSIQS